MKLYSQNGDGPATKPATKPTETQETSPENGLADVDLHALAQKVYALMKEELRTERERLGYSR